MTHFKKHFLNRKDCGKILNCPDLNFLGLCRRAGRLSCGHDAVIDSIVKNRAKLVLIAKDASERLTGEITHAASYNGKTVPVINTNRTTEEFGSSLGIKSAVYSVTDEHFAQKLKTLFGEEYDDQ